MAVDPPWDVAPVANPALPDRKIRRLIRRSLGQDPVGLAQPLYQLQHRDELVLPSALDPMSRELLIRAQTAIDSVADDTVDSPDIVTESTLRWHDSVLEPQRHALQLAQDAIESRVAALERYATEVLAASSALRDWQDALRISDLNDRYLDLVAHTAADEHAATEISGLTDQAAAAAQAVRESMRQVGLAASALALPETATG